MIPWMRGQITEAWNSRKSSRAARRQSLDLSSADSGQSENRGKMLVPSSTNVENFSVNVISLEGDVSKINISPEYTIDQIKSIAIKHFYGIDMSKVTSRFRLIHSVRFCQLKDNLSALNEKINEFDELILVEMRPIVDKDDISEDALKGPNKEAILQATNDLVPQNLQRPLLVNDCPVDFQNEIRKILITLVKTSAKLLTNSQDADKLYNILKEKLKNRCRPQIDPKIMQNLLDMGFPKNKVLKALCLRKSNMTEALEWLIDHQEDNDDEDNSEIEYFEENCKSDTAGPSTVNKKTISLKKACEDLFEEGNKNSENKSDLIYIVDLLLANIHQHKKLEFKPSPKLLQSLSEMGFEEKDIINALKITGNDQANACEWLLGERRQSLQDLDEGLNSNVAIYNAIMNNPHIQLSLTSHKMLLAYLSMLETPSSTNVWINDPEVSPVLSQIFKTYHAEKHAIQIN